MGVYVNLVVIAAKLAIKRPYATPPLSLNSALKAHGIILSRRIEPWTDPESCNGLCKDRAACIDRRMLCCAVLGAMGWRETRATRCPASRWKTPGQRRRGLNSHDYVSTTTTAPAARFTAAPLSSATLVPSTVEPRRLCCALAVVFFCNCHRFELPSSHARRLSRAGGCRSASMYDTTSTYFGLQAQDPRQP